MCVYIYILKVPHSPFSAEVKDESSSTSTNFHVLGKFSTVRRKRFLIAVACVKERQLDSARCFMPEDR